MNPAAAPARISEGAKSSWRASLAFFGGTATVYVLLRSHDMMAVDGAIRAFMVYHKPLVVTVNPHMFYQVWVWLWSHAFGLQGSEPLAYFRGVQAMNCLAAAACAAILFQCIRDFTDSTMTAVVGALTWAFAHVVVLHATNAAEPMTGLLWSVIALCFTVHGLRRRSVWPLVVAGVTLAVSMASYRSMVFIGLACGLMTLLWPAQSKIREPLQRASSLTGTFLLSVIAIFGYVAWQNGARSLRTASRMLSEVDAENVYFGLKPTKIVNSVVGYANGFVVAVPNDYAGLRSLIASHRLWLAWLGLCVCAVITVSIWLLRAASREDDRQRRAMFIGCGAAFLLGLFLLWSWDPIYHKHWLQPLWLMVLMMSVASTRVRNKHLLVLLVAIFSCVNVVASARAARGPWPNVEESKRVATIIGPKDLVIGGWSSVAVLYRNIWASESQSLDFPFEASTTGKQSLQTLQNRIESTRADGGRVYFLDLFDQDQPAWNGFLGARCGIPFEAMDSYRHNSTTVAGFKSDSMEITLRELR